MSAPCGRIVAGGRKKMDVGKLGCGQWLVMGEWGDGVLGGWDGAIGEELVRTVIGH